MALLRTALVTFGLIFLAELGDKTQLTTMMLAIQSKKPWAVFLGAAAALCLTSLLGVTVGEFLARAVPLAYVRRVAGVGFVVLGGLLLLGRL
mgnify:CR=1 FL=1